MTTAAERAGQEPWTEARMIELAARALGKVDVLGLRGVTLCSANEIAAMGGFWRCWACPPSRPAPRCRTPLQRPSREF